jgi:hypothetical protein
MEFISERTKMNRKEFAEAYERYKDADELYTEMIAPFETAVYNDYEERMKLMKRFLVEKFDEFYEAETEKHVKAVTENDSLTIQEIRQKAKDLIYGNI